MNAVYPNLWALLFLCLNAKIMGNGKCTCMVSCMKKESRDQKLKYMYRCKCIIILHQAKVCERRHQKGNQLCMKKTWIIFSEEKNIHYWRCHIFKLMENVCGTKGLRIVLQVLFYGVSQIFNFLIYQENQVECQIRIVLNFKYSKKLL